MHPRTRQTYQTSFAPSQMMGGGLHYFVRRRPLIALLIPALILIYFFARPLDLSQTHPNHPSTLAALSAKTDPNGLDFPLNHGPGPRIRQATMLYEGNKDGLRGMYVRSVDTHLRHGLRWGYPTHVLGRDLVPVEGKGGYFNKPAWLLNIIMTELAKPPEDSNRADWIVWFDGDSVIMNPSIPWSLFIPPFGIDDIHIIGTQDENGFNAGMLILHVDHWTVLMLSQVLALKSLDPKADLPFYDQSAIENICKRPGNREHFLYHPRHWWNRYFFTNDGREPGEFLLHFAGIGTGKDSGGSEEKERVMREFLEIAEAPPPASYSGTGEGGNWERPLESTNYEQETQDYWNTIKKVKDVLSRTEKWWEKHASSQTGPEVKEVEDRLRETLLWKGDHPETLAELAEELNGLIRKR